MEKLACIFTIIFLGFLATPSILAYVDSSVDVSIAFNLNEEESTSKNQISIEYTCGNAPSNYESIHFLQEQKESGHFYAEAYPVVFLDVISPPPKQV